jgi:deazaflavin-dependent oxidoreductase (nitroreductase family)
MGVQITPSGTTGGKGPRGGSAYRAGMRFATWIHRRTKDRAMGLDLLYLTTFGAKSNEERRVPLARFDDGEGGWLVVASFGGAAKHPAWYHNMAAHPDRIWVEFGNEKHRVTAESLHGEERERRFAEIADAHDRYYSYQAKTDREIPVVRLTPVN